MSRAPADLHDGEWGLELPLYLVGYKESQAEALVSFLERQKMRAIPLPDPSQLAEQQTQVAAGAILWWVPDARSLETLLKGRLLDPLIRWLVVLHLASGLEFDTTARLPQAIYSVIIEPSDAEALSLQAEAALERAHLHAQIAELIALSEEKFVKLSIYRDVGRSLTFSLDQREVLEMVTRKSAELVPAEATLLFLADEKTHRLTLGGSRLAGDREIGDIVLEPGKGYAGWVARERKPLLINQVRRDRRAREEGDISGVPVHSLLAVPVENRGRLLAVIEVINPLARQPVTKKELDLLLLFADHAAAAIENALLYERAQKLTVIDDLTNTYNFRFLTDVLERELHRARKFKTQVSLIFLDLDDFKAVNDRYGHPIGNIVLQEVAQRIVSSLRKVDIVARFGGDEFVIILPETNAEGALRVGKRVLDQLIGRGFLTELELGVRLTVSVGVATFPIHARTLKQLVKAADRAMYVVKQTGKNNVGMAEPMAASEEGEE